MTTNKEKIAEVVGKIVQEGFDQGHISLPSGTIWLTTTLTKLLEERDERLEVATHKCTADLTLLSYPPKYRCSVCGRTEDKPF